MWNDWSILRIDLPIISVEGNFPVDGDEEVHWKFARRTFRSRRRENGIPPVEGSILPVGVPGIVLSAGRAINSPGEEWRRSEGVIDMQLSAGSFRGKGWVDARKHTPMSGRRIITAIIEIVRAQFFKRT